MLCLSILRKDAPNINILQNMAYSVFYATKQNKSWILIPVRSDSKSL